MKFGGSLSPPNNLLIRNDLHGERRQLLEVHNNLISSPQSTIVSDGKNDMDSGVHMVMFTHNLLHYLILTPYCFLSETLQTILICLLIY